MKREQGFVTGRKALAFLLAMMLFFALPPAVRAEGAGQDAAEAAFPESAESAFPEELRVGHPTALTGDFFTDLFGDNTADMDVRALLHGYNLINWDQAQGVYVVDTSVVSDVLVMEDEEGNHSYYLSLWNDLAYSDGTPITAWDYAFSLLLQLSPEMAEIGGHVYRADQILGGRAYASGEADSLGGVEVISDHQLVITLDHEFLPYFFETGLLLCEPFPIHVIAPGCRVYDDGLGAYIGNEDKTAEEPLFTAELLRKTLLDPKTGYNSHPSVVSGPYCLTAFDGTTACFERNPYFKGTMDGKVPEIKKITFTVADNDTLIAQLREGNLHLVNKVVYGPAILAGMPEEDLRYTNYPRIGLAEVSFACEHPAVEDMAVRQAIAWCMDRAQLTQEYCGGFGLTVDGYYGIGQWEYQLLDGQIDYPISTEGENALSDAEYEAAVEKWSGLNLDGLTKYAVDTEKANALLDEAGWTLNARGETYRPGTDDVRCKQTGGELFSLDLSLLLPEGHHMAEAMEAHFIPYLKECGIRLNLKTADMAQLLREYYREAERSTDMIFLATNFSVVVDPSVSMSMDRSENHLVWNSIYSDDEELYRRAVDMRRTEPGDTYEYVKRWVAFQERYNQVLPSVPVYSNIYFDFYTKMLQNYNVSSHVTWSQAIVEAYFGADEPEEPAEGPDGEWDDDTIEFFD